MSVRIQLDDSEFTPIVEMVVAAALRRLRAEQPCDQVGRVLLNKREAAESLGVSPSTLDRLRREAGLPSVKLDGLVLFRPEGLRAWAEKNERESHLHA